jgi:hypothetical protein
LAESLLAAVPPGHPTTEPIDYFNGRKFLPQPTDERNALADRKDVNRCIRIGDAGDG